MLSYLYLILKGVYIMFGFFRAVTVVIVAGLAMRGLEVTVREIARDEADKNATK